MGHGGASRGAALVEAAGDRPEGAIACRCTPAGRSGRCRKDGLGKRDEGYRAFKFKVGFGAQKDRANFAEIRAALGDDAVVMIDANQAWSPDEAAKRIAELAPFRPHWVEEPIAADEPIPQWEDLARRCGVPLAAGENLRGLDEFADALTSECLAFVQPDVAKWGGLSGCRDWRSSRGGTAPSSARTGSGAASPRGLSPPSRGDGARRLREVDANPNPLREEVSCLRRVMVVTLPDAPGLGVEPDVARLERYRVSY